MKSEAIVITGFLEKLIGLIQADKVRVHEERMKELEVISNSNLRDSYAQLLLLDKFLAPIETAQRQMQDAAKHANWLAEMVNYYHQDHQASKRQGQEISTELRVLATKITQADSLYELKTIYEVTTQFTDQIARNFQHKERKYCLEREIRKGILDVLNTCIATENNFRRRIIEFAP